MHRRVSRLRRFGPVAVGIAFAMVAGVAGAMPADSEAPASVAATAGHAKKAVKNFADPGYHKFGKYYYLYKTGTGFKYSRSTSPNGPFSTPKTSMPKRPGWVAAKDSGLWAPDVFPSKRDGKTIYVMYFTGVLKGTQRHCVGTAVATRPSGPFTATKTKICANQKGYSTIDPSHFRDGSGQRYIVFKQNKGNRYGFKIVVMKMHPAGLAPVWSAGRHTKISTGSGAGARIEAPSVIRHGDKTWIFNARGDYVNCSYSTDAWAAGGLWNGKFTRVKTLMNSKSTGLCGPGGATVFNDNGTTRVAFHAWVGGVMGKGHRDTWTGVVKWTGKGKPYLY